MLLSATPPGPMVLWDLSGGRHGVDTPATVCDPSGVGVVGSQELGVWEGGCATPPGLRVLWDLSGGRHGVDAPATVCDPSGVGVVEV